MLGSAVDGWRTLPQLGGNHHDARTPSLESNGEGRQFCSLTVKTQSLPPVRACVAAVSALVSHVHTADRVKPSYLAASKKPELYFWNDDFLVFTLLWGFCISSIFSVLKDREDNFYWIKH